MIQNRVDAMAMLGVPYEAPRHSTGAAEMARAQAHEIATKLAAAGGPANVADKDVIALIAYMQRMGVDIRLPQGGVR